MLIVLNHIFLFHWNYSFVLYGVYSSQMVKYSSRLNCFESWFALIGHTKAWSFLKNSQVDALLVWGLIRGLAQSKFPLGGQLIQKSNKHDLDKLGGLRKFILFQWNYQFGKTLSFWTIQRGVNHTRGINPQFNTSLTSPKYIPFYFDRTSQQ